MKVYGSCCKIQVSGFRFESRADLMALNHSLHGIRIIVAIIITKLQHLTDTEEENE